MASLTETDLRIRMALRWLLTAYMVGAGVNHFLDPATYLAMTPRWLPAPEFRVYFSGIAEIAGGIGLIFPQTRKLAGWFLIATYIALMPATIKMAIEGLPFGTHHIPSGVLWGRIPVQVLLMAWAFWYTRTDTLKPTPAATPPSTPTT